MEAFVAADVNRIEEIFNKESNELKQIYGSRIDYYMQIPVVVNRYKQFNFDEMKGVSRTLKAGQHPFIMAALIKGGSAV